jgi:hypothetical protein
MRRRRLHGGSSAEINGSAVAAFDRPIGPNKRSKPQFFTTERNPL